jgi:hypothetical protein
MSHDGQYNWSRNSAILCKYHRKYFSNCYRKQFNNI